MLGLWLVEQQIITEAELDHALNIQLESGGRLGDILISEGATSPLVLYRAIAANWSLPFVDLLHSDWDKHYLEEQDIREYIRLRFLPIGDAEGLVIATSEPRTPQLLQYLQQRYGESVRLVVTSPLDIRRTIEQYFEVALTEKSQDYLSRLAPSQSAKHTLSSKQRYGFVVIFVTIVALFYFAPFETAGFSLLIANLLYVAALVFKALVFFVGLKKSPFVPPVLPINDADLPSVTILVPLYQEADNVQSILTALNALDYPKHKLDIKLVLEADDVVTIASAVACRPSYQFDMIRVPASPIRTKPKACNYALAFARGDIITIYDAEDRPELRQLRIVAECFDGLNNDVTCVQAKLRYDNAHENMLTRFFDIEYAILFEHLLPGLERLRMPIPLGGTSNHINAERLREIGEWDPYNVTEDADLGVRITMLGYKIRTIPSTTMEEAPITAHAWMRQRTRWIKGHMQTWLVFMRHPVKLYRNLGLHGFIGFHMFLGLPYFLFLTAPYVFVLSVFWQVGFFDELLPEMLGYLMASNLIAYVALHWLQGFYVCHTMHRHQLSDTPQLLGRYWMRETLAAFLFPAYWLLHIATSFIALHQLITRPHHWSKTNHGLSKLR